MNLDQRLADAAHGIAQQVDPPEVDLDTIRHKSHTSRRRAAAAVAVVAVAVALAAIPQLSGRPSTAPLPATRPTSEVVQILSDCSVPQCLQPGTYEVGLGRDSSARVWHARLVVQGGGWDAEGYVHRVSLTGMGGSVVLNVYQPYDLAGPDPCDADGASVRVAPDATTDEVVRLLATLPQFAVVDGPHTLTAFGREARYLQVVADPVTCPPVDGVQYNLADIYGGDGRSVGGDSDIDPAQRVLIRFWVVDLAGKPVVVEARQEGNPEQVLVDRLDQVRESVTFSTDR